jgi:polysaccharide biosynthesis protein PslJ
MTILGYPVGRPKALFAYTNQWGACAALLAPFAIAAFAYLRRPLQRQALGLCVLLSIVPFVVSLNRGVWIALGIAVLYAILRLARPSHGRAVVIGAVILLAGAAMVKTTPLGGLAHDRVVNDSDSTDTRMSLYASVAEQVRKAPLLGVGSPSVRTEEGTAPPVGTQGQIPLLAYSHGLPGLLLFLMWFAHAGLRSGRVTSPARFSAHVALVIAVLLMPYYSLLPVALHAVMVAAALALRDVFRPPEASAPSLR